MFNGIGGLGNIMKQAQMMQDKVKKVKEEIEKIEVEGQSGAGLVKVLVTGKHSVRKVTLDPSLKDEELDMLEDLIAAAFNDAVGKIEAESQQKMEKATAGMPIPKGLMDMF
jgi:hypothetical protein